MEAFPKPLRFLLPILSGCVLLAGCSSGNITISSGSSKPLDKRFFGEWRNESLRVECATYRGSDSTYVLNVPAGKWEAIMKMKPIRTTYKPDGSYISEYRSLGDSVLIQRQGGWFANGHELTMRETKPDTREYQFKYRFKGDLATFSSMLDFDSDGKNDDKYNGVQRKQ